MRPFSLAVLTTLTLAVPALLLPAVVHSELANNALYQWSTANGTTTFSPDPPPKGVKYVVVGPDLKPLAQQPAPLNEAQPPVNTTALASAGTKESQPIQLPEPVKKWKPVRYANAPANSPQTIVKSRRTKEPSGITDFSAPPTSESDACLTIKREKLVLESRFSRAKTAAEMDQAIVSLHKKTTEYGQKCQSKR